MRPSIEIGGPWPGEALPPWEKGRHRNNTPLCENKESAGMTKGLIGGQKGFEERRTHAVPLVEERRTHNHEITKQLRAERRERHRLHTLEKRLGEDKF